MGVINKFKNMIGLEDYDDYDEEYEEEYGKASYYDNKPAETVTSSNAATGRFAPNVVSMQEKKVRAITNAFKLVVIEPQGFEDCSRLVDSLKARKPIIINLEKLDAEMARKIFDFLGGATYALNGTVQKVAKLQSTCLFQKMPCLTKLLTPTASETMKRAIFLTIG